MGEVQPPKPDATRMKRNRTIESIAAAELEAPRELKVGDRVKLLTLGSTGIIDRIKGNEAEVRVGSLHMREKLANLEAHWR